MSLCLATFHPMGHQNERNQQLNRSSLKRFPFLLRNTGSMLVSRFNYSNDKEFPIPTARNDNNSNHNNKNLRIVNFWNRSSKRNELRTTKTASLLFRS